MSAVAETIEAAREPLIVDGWPLLLEPGVHEGMPDDAYRRAVGMNKSSLDILHRSPLHYITNKRNPKPSTPAMAIGSALHCLVLEPDLFGERYLADQFSGSYSKDAKAWRAEMKATGKTLIRTDADADKGIWGMSDWDTIHRMRDAVMSHPVAAALLTTSGHNELVCVWIDPLTRKLCKCRIDRHDDAHNVLIDLKTAADASYSGFARSVHDYRYMVQDAFYSDGARVAGIKAEPSLAEPLPFVFVVVEKEPPFAVGVYMLDTEWRRVGRVLYQHDMEIYKRCHEADEWPAYPPEIRDMSMPGFARFHPVS